MSELRVAIACGGTGGHVFPAVAVAEALSEARSSARVLLVGGRRGLENDLIPTGRFATAFVDSPKFECGAAGLPLLGARFVAAVGKAADVLSRFRPHVVVGTGGYASVAPVFAAKLLRRPIVLLEQNAAPGRANRLLARFAQEVHVQFSESAGRLPRRARARVSGNPVRRSVLGAARRRRTRRTDGPFTLLVMGGSQGARRINDALAGALPRLAASIPDMRVFHCAGPNDEDRSRTSLFMSGLAGRAWGFCTFMDELYVNADVAVSRAGATAIAELSCCGLASVLVPYPHARDGHQELNARALSREGACEIVEDAALDGRALADAVLALARDPVRRAQLSARIRGLARPDAADVVARRIEAVAGLAAPVRLVPAAVRRVA